MFNYITLDQVKKHLKLTSTADDEKLQDYIEWSSRLIEMWKGRRYDPRVQTRLYDVPQGNTSIFGVFDPSLSVSTSPRVLRLDDDLLEVTEILNGDEEEITAYVLEPANEYPKNRIRLRSEATFVNSDDGPEQAISVEGIWGYHDRWSDAWSVIGELETESDVEGGIDADDDEIILTDAEIGQLLRLDTEYVLVLDVADDVVTIERGYNGTTAAAHDAGTEVELFSLMGQIVQVCYRLVKWRYVQKDADNFDRSYVMGAGVISTPTSLPADVVRILGPRKARL